MESKCLNVYQGVHGQHFEDNFRLSTYLYLIQLLEIFKFESKDVINSVYMEQRFFINDLIDLEKLQIKFMEQMFKTYGIQDIFPVPFRNHTAKIIPESYLLFVQGFVSQLQDSKHILTSNSIEKIKAKQHSIRHHKFSFYPEYGSIIVMSREKKFMPISLGILFFKKLNSNAFTNENTYTQFVEVAEDFGYYEIQQRFDEGKSLEECHLEIKQLIDQNLKLLTKEQRNEKSPNFFKKIIEYALKNPISKEENKQTAPHVSIFGNNRPQEKKKLDIQVSNQSTINFQHLIFPDINNQLCFLIYSWIFGQEKTARILLLSFKIHCLQAYLGQTDKIQRQIYCTLKQCLNDLIKSYKYAFNRQIQSNKQNAFAIFAEIRKQIDNKCLDGKEINRISNIELSESLITQKQYEISQSIDRVKAYCNFSPTKLTNANDIGFTLQISKFSTRMFSQLLELKRKLEPKQHGLYYWISMVEKIFFELSDRIEDLEIDINEIKMINRQQLSMMHQVVNQYEVMMTVNPEIGRKYCFNLKNQGYSHVYLIKYLAAAYAFELLRKNAKSSPENFQLDEYRISINIQNLYKNFTSMNYEARRALQNLVKYYQRNQHKQVMFSLNNNLNQHKALKKLVIVFCRRNKKAEDYLKSQEAKIQKQIKQLQDKFTSFRIRYNSAKSQYNMILNNACTCTYGESYFRPKVTCKKCLEKDKMESIIHNLQRQKFSTILAELPNKRSEKHLFAYFINMESIPGGAIKIILDAQVPIVKKQLFQKEHSNLIPSLSPLSAYSHKKQTQNKYLTQIIDANIKAESYVVFQDPIKLYYYNYSSSVQLDQLLLAAQTNQSYATLQWMIQKPTNHQSRQHMVYANLDTKHQSKIRELQSVTIEQYKIYGSIRVCCKTELIILSQAILSRSAVPITYKLHQFQRLIMMNACGSASSFRPSSLDRILTSPNSNKQIFENQLELVKQSMTNLLQKYLDQWKFEDLYSIGVNGFILCIFSFLLNQPQMIVRIVQRAFTEYEKLKRQNQNRRNAQNKLKQLYFLHSIMSCFSEDICKQSPQACIIFAKIMVNYRLNKKLLSSQNNSKNVFATTIKLYQNYFNNAVLKNIQSVVNYFKENSSDINQIVYQVDEGINKSYEWSFDLKQNYVFTAKGENRYDINLFQGIVLKNGAQTSQLPTLVKQNQYYIQIFGKFSDLEVYQEKNGAIRTRTNFSHHFKHQTGTKVFFQFYASYNGVKIRLIFDKESDKRCYLLIPHQVLTKQSIYIPQLYLESYQCWIDEKDYHLIFRKKELRSLNKIGLVLMYSNQENLLDKNDARIITKQFQEEPLSYLTQRQHHCYFQKLLIIGKDHVNNKALEILSSIESPKYILQIYSSGYAKKTIFWLHRCGLKFIYDEISKRLISQNYQGYFIPNQYRHHQLLPWNVNDQIRCLVIQKQEKSLRAATMHQFTLLLPNQKINKGGSVKIIEGSNYANEILNYDIHDSFMDIRSKTRLNHLHLACLISSLSSGKTFKPLMMSNEQYCISIMRSCYSNQLLNRMQCGKILNLISLCVELNLNVLLLCCQVLCKLTSNLIDVLAYKNIEEQEEFISKLLDYLASKAQLLRISKVIYRFKYENGLISVHSKLNKAQITILGINQNILMEIDKKEKLTKWYKEQSFQTKIDQKTMKGLNNITEQYYKTQKDIEHLKETIMKFFEKEDCSDDPQKEFNIQLRLNDALSQEMFSDLKSSYNSYLRYSQKYEKLELTKQESIKRLISYFTLPKQKCQKCKKQLTKFLDKINDKNSGHLDMIVGRQKIITPQLYTEILCNPSKLYQIYPKINKQQGDAITKGIHQWILLTLEIESISRILIILDERPIDKIALFRELESPRQHINQKNYWVCFEAEMKIRIWLSQYDTYKHLRQSKSGSVSQLNMGQGKTQVIIPMIVLDNHYDPSYGNPITRINILSSLFKQAQSNYFRFFSMTSFRIPVFSWYFSRQVQLNKSNIHKLKFMIYLLRQKTILLMDRESCLSMVLKICDEMLKKNDCIKSIGKFRDEWIFDDDYNLYDINDEVDALMTSKKSFVYSIGPSSELLDAGLRFQYSRILLQIISSELFIWLIDEKLAIMDETMELALQNVQKGGYPKGLRLKQNLSKKSLLMFRERLVLTLIQDHNYRPAQFKFYQSLNGKQREILVRYLTDQTFDEIGYIQQFLPQDINQIYAVRGLIAFGILEHCLTMRNGVDYGVPGEEHPKSLGVPYQAGDLPSKRSQFSHPDVSILISYISYFVKGLTQQQFTNAVHQLFKKPDSAKHHYYELWYNIIKDEKFKPTDVSQFKQINIDSSGQIEYLYQKYKFNRNMIVFWLTNIIFPKDLRQFASSITSSCYDIANVKKSVGFSGTKDTRWLFPTYLKWDQSQNDVINGTDGKMIHLMINHTLDILQIADGKQSLWQRFCQQILQLKDDDLGSIIDAGAILVGKSFEKEIIPWIVKNPLFKKHKFKGITFCDENGKWKVYDTTTLSIVERGTSISEHETFVIFDQARTRGADIKMASGVKAVLSLSPCMTKDKLMQAVGRLRKFGRHQQIYIMATPQIIQKIEGLGFNDIKQDVRTIIQWTCQNSLDDNRKTLYANSRLAQIHFKTILSAIPDVQTFDSSLKSLYSGKITEKSIYEIYRLSIESKFGQESIKKQQFELLSQKMKSYGSDYVTKSYEVDDVCERQVQFVVQTQKIVINQYEKLCPQKESDVVENFIGQVSSIDFKFNQKLNFSKNFINCTQQKGTNSLLIFAPVIQFQFNQLSNIQFFLWNKDSLTIITQRQMCLELERNTPSFGYYQLNSLSDFDKRFVGKWKDLTKYTAFIQACQLEKAFVHAEFFNGSESYDYQGRNILSNLIKSYLRRPSQNNSLFGLSSSKKQLNIQNLVCHYLNRRRTYQSKFVKSDLEKIVVGLKSITKNELYSQN